MKDTEEPKLSRFQKGTSPAPRLRDIGCFLDWGMAVILGSICCPPVLDPLSWTPGYLLFCFTPSFYKTHFLKKGQGTFLNLSISRNVFTPFSRMIGSSGCKNPRIITFLKLLVRDIQLNEHIHSPLVSPETH